MCARGRRPAREPSAPRASLGASSRSPARPRRRPRAPQPGPATAHGRRSQALRTLRRPPHQWGWGADVWLCVSSRSLARPRRRPRAPQPGHPDPPAPFTPVVPGVLACGLARCLVARPGPAAAHGYRSQAPRFAARPCPPVPPAPSAPVGPGVLAYGLARRLEAWPGPAAAHGHRSLAFRSLRRPPHQWCPVAVVWFGACCYKRRQSELLFVRIFLRLLQTSSIRRHFCEK